MTPVIRAYINAQRQALEQLESFAGSPEFERLLATLQLFVGRDEQEAGLVAWLAAWLIEPDEALGDRPLNIAEQPGGLELLVVRIERMAGGVCA